MRIALALALVLLLADGSAAVADTGAVTRAEANAAWTTGSFAGSVEWTGCAETCSWIPVATVQPTLPVYRCLGDEALDSDPNTRVVWNGGGRTSNGVAPFDVVDVPILAGVFGQRLCLSAIETVRLRDPVCVAQAPILGMDPNSCSFINRIVGRALVDRGITVAAPPPAQQVVPTPTPAPTQAAPVAVATPAPPPAKLTATRAKSAAVTALTSRYGRAWRQRSGSSVRCTRRSDAYRCSAHWRHGRKRYAAIVTVRVERGKIRTRVARD
jgi:hypothetical protein